MTSYLPKLNAIAGGQYLSQRVTKVFGIASSQAKELIVCAEIRPKLPEISAAPAAEVGWTAKAVYQFRRLAPQDENHSQRFDYSRLQKVDVARVAKAAMAMAVEAGTQVATIEGTETEGVLHMTQADFEAFNSAGGGLLAAWDAEPWHHVAIIPEPSSLLLMAMASVGLIGRRW